MREPRRQPPPSRRRASDTSDRGGERGWGGDTPFFPHYRAMPAAHEPRTASRGGRRGGGAAATGPAAAVTATASATGECHGQDVEPRRPKERREGGGSRWAAVARLTYIRWGGMGDVQRAGGGRGEKKKWNAPSAER